MIMGIGGYMGSRALDIKQFVEFCSVWATKKAVQFESEKHGTEQLKMVGVTK